jgi:hypothetical protein
MNVIRHLPLSTAQCLDVFHCCHSLTTENTKITKKKTGFLFAVFFAVAVLLFSHGHTRPTTRAIISCKRLSLRLSSVARRDNLPAP